MGKKNILFICGHYAFPSAANSICVQNLAEEFVRQGHNVFVLARGCEYTGQQETINGVTVWKQSGNNYQNVFSYLKRRKGLLWQLLLKVVQFARYSIVLWYYPVIYPRDIPKVHKKARNIIDNYSINTIVATYMSYDNIKVAMKLKDDYGDRIQVVSYHLDLLTNPHNESKSIHGIKLHLAHKVLNKEFATVDRILLPNSAPLLDHEKIRYVDFPLYVPNNASDNINAIDVFDDNCINIAIAGTLDSINRNPSYFCKLISSLSTIQGKRIILHIWGAIKDVNLGGYQNVIHHGMAKVEEVPAILNGCDFLLNIGNRITYDMVPSKIFQMFAAKKPIIFCIASKNDKSLPYFQKYKYVCMVDEYMNDSETDILKIQTFINTYLNTTIFVEDNLYESSTPIYICKKIIE